MDTPGTPDDNNKPEQEQKYSYKWWKAQVPTIRGFIGENISSLIALSALVVSLKACDNTRRSARAAEESARAAKQSATAAQENVTTAKASLEATIERDRRDQRVWVGATEALPPPKSKNGGEAMYLNDGEPVAFEVFLVNSGKTPAKNVHQRITFITLPASEPFSPKYPTALANIGVLQPGVKFRWSTPTTEERVSALHIQSYQHGTGILYLFGEVTYDDIFSAPHVSTFCMYLVKDLKSFASCDTYNDAD